MLARIGLAADKDKELDEYNARWLRFLAEVDGYAEEERVLSKAEAIITRLYVRDMQLVKRGDPLVSLAGEDALNLIQGRLAKIRDIRQTIQQLCNHGFAEYCCPMDSIVAYVDAMPGRVVQRVSGWAIFIAEDMRLTAGGRHGYFAGTAGAPVDITVDACRAKLSG